MITFIILGIIQGSVIGLLAIGIVLVYKGSRVFNFAQAEFGSVAAFMLYFFVRAIHVPYPISILLTIIVVGAFGFAMERLVVRPLFNAPRVTLLVATAGIALLAIALELKIGGAVQRTLSPAISGRGFTIFSAQLSPQKILTVLVLIGLAIALAYFFNKTDLGLAVLATSQEPVATELAGIGTKRMSSFIWVFAAVLGAIAGILNGPDTTITPGFLTFNYLLPGFTAAVVGGITSLAGAFIGGQIIGIVQSLGSYFDANYIHHRIPGISDLMVFVVLLGILLIRPKGLLGSEA